jgi:hypothetical protein
MQEDIKGAFAAAFGVSLVRGDILYRLQRRIGLIPPDGPGIGRRALFWSLFAWLPIALWAWYTGRALPPAVVQEPLLGHFGIHVRFLVAVPLFILAEGMAHGLTMQLLPYFVQSGVVPEREMARFREVLAGITKLRDTAMPWIAILAFVVAALTITDIVREPHEAAWALEGDGSARHLGFGVLWFLYVGRPIYLTLLIGWVWRVILMFLLFRGVASLDLAIVPTHPDRAGGLGFLERFPKAFAPVVLAAGAVLAAGWAHDVVYHGVSVQSLRLPMIAFVVTALLVFLSPLLVFAGPLLKARKQALLDYGALVGGHGRLVRERWIEGRDVKGDAILNAPELGPVADTVSLYEAVKAMRVVPLGKASVAPILLAAAAPMLVVLAIEVPVKDILKMLMKALI